MLKLFARDVIIDDVDPGRGGAGSALNPAILISAGVATFVATVVSLIGIALQLKVSPGNGRVRLHPQTRLKLTDSLFDQLFAGHV